MNEKDEKKAIKEKRERWRERGGGGGERNNVKI